MNSTVDDNLVILKFPTNHSEGGVQEMVVNVNLLHQRDKYRVWKQYIYWDRCSNCSSITGFFIYVFGGNDLFEDFLIYSRGF